MLIGCEFESALGLAGQILLTSVEVARAITYVCRWMAKRTRLPDDRVVLRRGKALRVQAPGPRLEHCRALRTIYPETDLS